MSKSIKFNAGKTLYDEDSKKCNPLPHKGQVTIRPASDDGFYDFIWAPKSNSGLERDELLIIPGDVTFKPVKSCHTGRVVALTFLSSGAKNLYWLQDVGDDDELDQFTAKDLELVGSVQALVAADDDETEDSEMKETDIVEKKEEKKVEDKETKDTPASQNPAHGFPIVSLDDLLTEEVVSRHLDRLSESQMAQLYGDLLPQSVSPTKSDILRVIRSGFFHQANKELSQTMSEDVGHILASSFGYEYSGEGIEAFLRGLRSLKDK